MCVFVGLIHMLLLSDEVLLQQVIKLASCLVCRLKVGSFDHSLQEKVVGWGIWRPPSEVIGPYIPSCLRAILECLINSVAIMRQYSILLKVGNLFL
jgi:hypothetical protein